MSNIPKLRFPEFSGEWEEKKLNSIFTKITQRNSDNQNSNVITNSATEGLVSQRDYFDKDIANKDKTDNYFIIKNGDFVYNPRKSSAAPYGPFTQYKLLDDGIVSPLYLCLRKNNSEVESKYLENYFKTTCWHQYIYENGSSGARHDRVSIHDDVLLAMPIKVPSLPEQQKIADFLSNVDSIITAETKILNTLQKKKKALMQKLFTRQLRFKSADGTDFPTWEEKKFSEVFIYHQTNTFSRNMLNYEEGDTYNIHYGDILVKFGSYIDFDNSKIPFINSDVTLNKFVSDSFLKDGDIIIADTAEDESAGKVSEVYNINNKKALSGLHTILCRPKQIFASKYLGYFMNSNVYHKQIVKLLVGTKVLSINKSVIADTIIQIPCLAEQQKIADCLSSLDSLIQTQQNVVTTWQQRKKALLQQMFV